MKREMVTVYAIHGVANPVYRCTLKEAEEALEVLRDWGYSGVIKVEQQEKITLEVGDYVNHVANSGEIDKTRTDKITKIAKNSYGDTVYFTKEINGVKIGCVYPNHVALA